MQDEKDHPVISRPHTVPRDIFWRIHDPADIIAPEIKAFCKSFQVIENAGSKFPGYLCNLPLDLCGDQDLVRQSDPQFVPYCL